MTTTAKPASQLRYVLITAAVTLAATYGAITLASLFGSSATTPYRTPPIALALHLATVIPALPLGAFILWTRKGNAMHKQLGRVWALMMLTTAITSFWLRGATGGIGPIHIFSVVTLISIPLAVYHVRRGNIRGHRRAMTGPYIGLVVAGLFAFVPGRLLGTLVFG
jgi:uncharacterized membrane protein